jgi:hypothetical protein
VWATLIPVVVGGVIALAGSWLGPQLVERRREAEAKRQRRAAKFEELLTAVYEYDLWTDNTMRARVWGEEVSSTVSPFAKIEAIAAVYFPQFTRQVEALNATATKYLQWMTMQRRNARRSV